MDSNLQDKLLPAPHPEVIHPVSNTVRERKSKLRKSVEARPHI
ncbi:hypothetical protein [Prochlorococcus marinus]|nr:hypothetical protein [Prochlorococcus marinus]